MPHKDMRRCSTSFIIREMQIKATTIYRFTLTVMAIIKKKPTSVAENVEKLEPLCVAGGNVQWCSSCEKKYGGASKI